MNGDTKRRYKVLLIELGKQSPFIVCGVVLLSYIECLVSLLSCNYAIYESSFILYKPVSWAIADIVEYNLTTVIVLFVISLAIETCKWNKLTILYLLIQLYEKRLFSDIELDLEIIYVIIISNIVLCLFLIRKGATIKYKLKFIKN